MHRSSRPWSLNVLFSIVFSSCRALAPWFSNTVGLTMLCCHFHFGPSFSGSNLNRAHHNCDFCLSFVFFVHFPPAKSFGNRVKLFTMNMFISLIQWSFSHFMFSVPISPSHQFCSHSRRMFTFGCSFDPVSLVRVVQKNNSFILFPFCCHNHPSWSSL